MTTSRAECEALDRSDPLRHFRERFHLPTNLIYLDGNSLGALPVDTPGRIRRLIEHEWADHLVSGWSRDGWMEAPERVGEKLGRLLGAQRGEVVVGDSTSVCLFKLLAASLTLNPDRSVILTERENFPTDLYIPQGLETLLGGRCSVRAVAREELLDALDESVCVLSLTHVDYRTGFMHEMADLTARAHTAGALALWDLSHSAGAVPVSLSEAGADLAVGCEYKYLNGGPGAPAFMYVAQRHHSRLTTPISGWLGHAEPFAFAEEFRPAAGVRQLISGSPSVLSLQALEVGVDLLLEADATALREKSVGLTETFIDGIAALCEGSGVELATPRDHQRRGSQVSFHFAEGYPLVAALIDRGVVGDFRAPDICRFGFAPLYLRYVDAWDAAEAITSVLTSGAHRDPRYATPGPIT